MEMSGRLVDLILGLSIHLSGSILKMEKISSPAGNRTPVSCVTGEDTYHYTTEDGYKMTMTQIDAVMVGLGLGVVSLFQTMVNSFS